MVSWRDNLIPASFRDVPFFYFDADQSGGRRVAEHEFPLRDAPYVEDLGRRARKYQIQAYVLGDDYFTARDNLITALEAEGSGTLKHPYRGPLDVFVREFRVSERRDDGRMAVFDIEFIESGTQPSPVSTTDTAGQASDASDAALDQAQQTFDDEYLDDDGGYLNTAALSLIGDLLIALLPLFTWPGVDTSTARADVANLASLVINGPATFGAGTGFNGGTGGSASNGLSAAIAQCLSDYADAVIAILPVTPDDTQTSRGIPLPADYTYGLAGLATFGNTFLPVTGGLAPQAMQQQTNQTAFVNLVQQCAVAAIARVLANTQFGSANDADDQRTLVMDLIDTLSLNATDDPSYQALIALGQAVSSDLTTRGKQLPFIIDYNIGANLPAVVLAQRFYQDPTRAGELIARNNPANPLFMPTTVEALSQ